MFSSGGGMSSSQSNASGVSGDNTAGAVNIGGITMGMKKDPLADALKWGLVALAVVAIFGRKSR